MHSLPLFPLEGGGEVEPPNKFSKRKKGLTGGLTEGSCWGRRGVTFFRWDCSFYIKNKLKSAIFNDKKS